MRLRPWKVTVRIGVARSIVIPIHSLRSKRSSSALVAFATNESMSTVAPSRFSSTCSRCLALMPRNTFCSSASACSLRSANRFQCSSYSACVSSLMLLNWYAGSLSIAFLNASVSARRICAAPLLAVLPPVRMRMALVSQPSTVFDLASCGVWSSPSSFLRHASLVTSVLGIMSLSPPSIGPRPR